MWFPSGPACGWPAQGFSGQGSHSGPGDISTEIIINHINQCSVFNVRFESTSGSVKLGPVTSVVKSMRK